MARTHLALALMLLTGAVAAADGGSIMQKGGSNPAALPCITCHGADGKGIAAGGFPRLAGLPASYIAKQLGDFRSGARQNPLMQPIAGALGDEEIAAVAKAYSEKPRVNVLPQPAVQPAPGSGAWIALRGAWDRNIPECTLCHGPSGVGVGASFPPLAGQSAAYIEAQLKAWRGSKRVAGRKGSPETAPTRRNDPNGLMRHIAADLTPGEIAAVAEYFAGLGDSEESFDETQHRLR